MSRGSSQLAGMVARHSSAVEEIRFDKARKKSPPSWPRKGGVSLRENGDSPLVFLSLLETSLTQLSDARQRISTPIVTRTPWPRRGKACPASSAIISGPSHLV